MVFSHARAKLAGLFAILVLSACTMMWMIWRFPLLTALTALGTITVLGISAKLARLMDGDIRDLSQSAELEQGSTGP